MRSYRNPSGGPGAAGVSTTFRWAAVTWVFVIDQDGVARGPGATSQSGLADTLCKRWSMLPRRFALVRQVDYTGVSGVGVVAYGVVFADGHVVLRWSSDHPATSMWNSLDDLMAVHGHGDGTTVEWIDPTADLIAHLSPKNLALPPSPGSSPGAGPGSGSVRPATHAPASLLNGLPVAVPHQPGRRVPTQRRSGRHRRPDPTQETQPTQPIESPAAAPEGRTSTESELP